MRLFGSRNRRAASPLVFAAVVFLCAAPAAAAIVSYDLNIATKTVDFAGRPSRAVAVNGSIPGPTLYFHEGDDAVIRVHDGLSGRSTSIHWHGMLVPNAMDGVPYLTYPPIAPGKTFTYRFPIKQTGTYWYHSHSGFQEQQGLYGAIVIKPEKSRFKPGLDLPVVLSDWTDENPRRVLWLLKSGNPWPAIEKETAQSLWGAWRMDQVGAYFKRELLRMPSMGDSDVYYPRFLANGRAELDAPAKPGELVRLRVIDASASTFFYLQYAGGPMRVVAADGQDVEPFKDGRFLISMAETYDVLVRVPESGGRWEFRATAQDGSGRASVWIGSGSRHSAPDVPMPNLYRMNEKLSLAKVFALTPAGSMGMGDAAVDAGKFDRPGMMMGAMSMSSAAAEDMSGMKEMHAMSGMAMGAMNAPAAGGGTEPKYAADGSDYRPLPPYARLRSLHSTAPPPGRPLRVYRLTLDGDMTRYVWMINGKILSKNDSLIVRKGETVRFILVNRTMMSHPMHLHGHFFRVLNGQGAYSPLKHTVDVPPMSTVVIEFPADAAGDWLFHCHVLYHMMSGMERVVHYQGFKPDAATAAVRGKLYADPYYFYGSAAALSQMTQGFLKASDSRNDFTARWESGWGEVPAVDWDGTLTYGRWINRFFTAFAGADWDKDKRFQNSRAEVNGIAGLRYLLPFSVDSRVWVDSSGGGRFILERSLQLTPRLDLDGEAEYDTKDLWVGKVSLSYRLSEALSFMGEWHSQYGFGAGLRCDF